MTTTPFAAAAKERVAEVRNGSAKVLSKLGAIKDAALSDTEENLYNGTRFIGRESRRTKKQLTRRAEDMRDESHDLLEDGIHQAGVLYNRGSAFMKDATPGELISSGVTIAKRHPVAAVVVLAGVAALTGWLAREGSRR